MLTEPSPRVRRPAAAPTRAPARSACGHTRTSPRPAHRAVGADDPRRVRRLDVPRPADPRPARPARPTSARSSIASEPQHVTSPPASSHPCSHPTARPPPSAAPGERALSPAREHASGSTGSAAAILRAPGASALRRNFRSPRSDRRRDSRSPSTARPHSDAPHGRPAARSTSTPVLGAKIFGRDLLPHAVGPLSSILMNRGSDRARPEGPPARRARTRSRRSSS